MKVKVLFLAGGQSGEHEISLISAKHILAALDRKKFDPLLLVIQKDGRMTLVDESSLERIDNNPKKIKSTPEGKEVLFRPYFKDGKPAALMSGADTFYFDRVFPILHGPGGEDGTIQGLFELCKIPVVGCGLRSSSICMDKAMTKYLCMQKNIPVAPFSDLHESGSRVFFPASFPVFVKPAHTGSSLGVSKVKKADELLKAIELAFSMDNKILVEPAIEGREIEVAVLGKIGNLIVSPAGEIRPKAEFYSYEAKYVDEDGAELIFPANLSPSELNEVQDLAKKVFETLDCNGMARIDFFLNKAGQFLLNEVNTIPGFTPISMYPKLIQLAGISYSELITRLIELAA